MSTTDMTKSMRVDTPLVPPGNTTKGSPTQPSLADLVAGDAFHGTYLLRRVELRKTRQQKDFLDMEIQDRTATLQAKLWDATPDAHRALSDAALVEVAGRIEVFQERRQARLHLARPQRARAADLRDLLPRTDKDVEDLFGKLRSIVASVRNTFVRRLLDSFLDDDSIAAPLKEAPAGVSNHHAYLGGLLEHVVSLAEACLKACEAYPDLLDRDLVIAGAILHDIGKVDELSLAPRGFEYSDRGRLIGHIVTGVLWVEERARRIAGFPPDLLDRLKHLILSHHGELQWGSPVTPLTAEAIALHALDNLDAKLWAYDRAVRESAANGSSFTEWSKMFGRRLFKHALAAPRDGNGNPGGAGGSAEGGNDGAADGAEGDAGTGPVAPPGYSP